MNNLLNSVIAIAKQAGEAINALYNEELIVEVKADASPLTQADLQANQIIMQELQQLIPNLPVISEENKQVPFSVRAQWEAYWLVDPLDGTKEFLEKNGEFTVNIALIKNNYPVLGVVYAPALAICYFAAESCGAFKQINEQTPQKIVTKNLFAHAVTVVASRHHGENSLQHFLKKIPNNNLMSCGSSLKFCLVAEGKADIYPRLSPTSEWDTAAAQCILEQAGGAILINTGERLFYNKKESLLNPHFLAVGDKEQDWQKYF